LDQRKVVLGAKLFADTRLSGDGTVSCATCHDLAKAGQDGIPVARGIEGKLGQNNTPTVFNSGLNFRQFWDGRAETLEEQADGPTTNPVEMNGNWPEIIAKLQNDPAFMAEYQSIWSNELSPQNIKKAIAEYERSLVTFDAPFDKYLKGQTDALNVQALEGWKLFQKLGCISCHQGVNIGGNMYANLGILGDYFKDRGRPETLADRGRFNVTGNADDLHLFKVPSLRNVALTAPYFHDGSVPTLGDAVEIMAKYQLGVNLTAEQHAAILSFLNSLTGIFPGQVQ
jgi:cytochrome c peroxidase